MENSRLAVREKSSLPVLAAILAAGSLIFRLIFSFYASMDSYSYTRIKYKLSEHYYSFSSDGLAIFLLSAGALLLIVLVLSYGKKQPRLLAIPVVCFAAGFFTSAMIQRALKYGFSSYPYNSFFSKACGVIMVAGVALICVLFLLFLFTKQKRIKNTLIVVILAFAAWNTMLILFAYFLRFSSTFYQNKIAISDNLMLFSFLFAAMSLDQGERDPAAQKAERIFQYSAYVLYSIIYGLVYITVQVARYENSRTMYTTFYGIYRNLEAIFLASMIIATLAELIALGVVFSWEFKATKVQARQEVLPIVLLLLFLPEAILPVWFYRMIKTLRGENDRSAVAELMFCLCIPFYSLYWIHKASKRLHWKYMEAGVPVSDFAVSATVLMFLLPAAGIGYFQSKYNHFCRVQEYQNLQIQNANRDKML